MLLPMKNKFRTDDRIRDTRVDFKKSTKHQIV